MIDAIQVRFAGATRQLVAPQLDASEATVLDASRKAAEIEAVAVERGAIAQFCPGQVHQHSFKAAARVPAILGPDTKLVLHLLVEVLQQELARLDHRLVDLTGQVELELLEAGLDFVRLTAVLIDLCNAPLEIDAR